MYVSKGNSFLPTISLKTIEKKYKEEKNSKAKIRLQCAILRKKGRSIPFISEVTGKAASTVSDILRRYRQRGINGCYAIKQGVSPSCSTGVAYQLEQLDGVVSANIDYKEGTGVVIYDADKVTAEEIAAASTEYPAIIVCDVEI